MIIVLSTLAVIPLAAYLYLQWRRRRSQALAVSFVAGYSLGVADTEAQVQRGIGEAIERQHLEAKLDQHRAAQIRNAQEGRQ